MRPRERTPRSQGLWRWYALLPESRKALCVALATTVVLTVIYALFAPAAPRQAPVIGHSLSQG